MEANYQAKMAYVMQNTPTGVILPFLLGISMHHSVFIHGEWHHYAPSIVLGHFTLFILLLAFRSIFKPTEVIQAVRLFQHHSSSLAYSSVPRLFFHPLRALPGSRLASLSNLSGLLDQFIGKNVRLEP